MIKFNCPNLTCSQTYSMPDGFVFKSSRVNAGFQMPEYDLVS